MKSNEMLARADEILSYSLADSRKCVCCTGTHQQRHQGAQKFIELLKEAGFTLRQFNAASSYSNYSQWVLDEEMGGRWIDCLMIDEVHTILHKMYELEKTREWSEYIPAS
jgi:hypothetical protein